MHGARSVESRGIPAAGGVSVLQLSSDPTACRSSCERQIQEVWPPCRKVRTEMEGELWRDSELPNRVRCFWGLNLAAPDRLLNVDEALLQVYVFDSQTTQFPSPHSGFGRQPVKRFQWSAGRGDDALDLIQREEEPRLPRNLRKHKSFKWIV